MIHNPKFEFILTDTETRVKTTTRRRFLICQINTFLKGRRFCSTCLRGSGSVERL